MTRHVPKPIFVVFIMSEEIYVTRNERAAREAVFMLAAITHGEQAFVLRAMVVFEPDGQFHLIYQVTYYDWNTKTRVDTMIYYKVDVL